MKLHELDSLNLGGHLHHYPNPCYNLPLRRREMGCGWVSLIQASTGSGVPEVPEPPSARRYILASELIQSSTFGAQVFDHRSCPFYPSMSD
ncbi:hypothetical protein AVEN_172393-1 [Araneus ventricosus]|uniref:Uncharacterized protein n=1 Tax=Araneus ventricosus TaxID=182803 RepID=A0A4Y2L1Y0_ARAVE|nr:hypothetical protein AVEN_172393-1 [Araneus ventricosus]